MLVGWEVSVYLGAVSALFFPAPSTIATTLVRLILRGDLLMHLGTTLSRLALGLTIGGISGLVLGLGMGWSPRLRRAADPFVAAVHPIPKITVLPLIMIVFGIGETSKIVVVAVGAFFPMLISSMAAVRQISPIYFEVASNYGASQRQVFTRVVLPGSLPLVLAGARLAMNVALLITISVEMVTAHQGLGAMIWLAWETLRTEHLYVGLLVASVLGISSARLLQGLTSRLVPWQSNTDR